MRSLSVLLLLLTTACAYDAEPAPADTTRRTDRELCQHFTDEVPYDAERAGYLQSRADEYCR